MSVEAARPARVAVARMASVVAVVADVGVAKRTSSVAICRWTSIVERDCRARRRRRSSWRRRRGHRLRAPIIRAISRPVALSTAQHAAPKIMAAAGSSKKYAIELLDDEEEEQPKPRRSPRKEKDPHAVAARSKSDGKRKAAAPPPPPPPQRQRSGPTANSTVIALSDSDDEDTAAAAAIAAATSFSADEWRRPTAPITCPICFCEEEPENSCVLASCSHAFCVECISTFVQGKVTEGQVTPEDLKCPCIEPERCGVSLVPSDVKRCLASTHERERYERLAFNRVVEAEDDMGTCPTAGCPFAFVWEADNRKLECPLCNKSFCLVCRCEPWHTGMRCEAYQKKRAEEAADLADPDAAFTRFASSQSLKQCPKCKFWVEKTSGCDAMHCRCNLVFCYKCGGCLKQTAKQHGLQECKCGRQDHANLAAHEAPGVANHNRPDLQPHGPAGAAAAAAGAHAAAMAQAMNAAAVRMAARGMPIPAHVRQMMDRVGDVWANGRRRR